MKIRYIFLAAALSAATVCSAQKINPITQAMLDGYNEWLASNPNDYQTLYERGMQYYQLNMLDNAYLDLVKAIDNTPAKDQDARARAFSALSDVLAAQGNYARAFEAIEKCLQVAPNSYNDINKKGELLLKLDRPQEAYTTFQSLQHLRTRSQEAFFGMAKARAIQGEIEDANDLIKEVEASDPSNFMTYVKVGDYYKSLNMNEEAANNYLIAYAMADQSSVPMTSLLELGRKDYNATVKAINYGLKKTNNVLPLNFLKANIANVTGNYNDAYEAFTSLLNSPEGRDPDVYFGMAKAALALNKIPDAQAAINSAISSSGEPHYYLLKAAIERAAQLPSAALEAAGKAEANSKTNSDALIEKAFDYIDLNNIDAALASLNECVLNNADDPLPLMIRAYIYKDIKKDEKKASADYQRVGLVQYESFPEITYAAMAKTLNGKRIDGDAMIEEAAKKHIGKNDAYWIAVYYAQTGNLDKAREWRDRAVSLGYSNLYNLDSNKNANLNLAPIR